MTTEAPTLVCEHRELRRQCERCELTRERDEAKAHAVQLSGEIFRYIDERDEARDCGQDGPCANSPGCQRHWEERNRELVSDLAAASAECAALREALKTILIISRDHELWTILNEAERALAGGKP